MNLELSQRIQAQEQANTLDEPGNQQSGSNKIKNESREKSRNSIPV